MTLALWPWGTTGFYGFIERTSCLWVDANRARGLEIALAHPKVSIEGWTRRRIVNMRADGGQTLGVDPSASICVELYYVRPSA
jgi:hypothetical protein